MLALLLLAVLAVYWLTLAITTHIPRLEPKLPISHPDKWVHAAAFCVLALLLAWNWSLRATFGMRQALLTFAILAAYGAIDEITQIPVGRHGNLADWAADLLGAALGVTLFIAARAALGRPRVG